MSDTTPRSGYVVTLAMPSLSEVGDVLGRAHGNAPIACILKNPTEVYGPVKGTVDAVREIAEKYTEGYTYGARAEVRWKADGGGKWGFCVLVLTEDFDLAASLDASPENDDGDRRMEVTFYNGYREGENHISSVNFWLPTETRLPGQCKYPVDLFRSYAVYRNAKTQAAEFTRLIPG